MPTEGGPLPNFVIVGAARAGSTALHGYLSAHPEIYLPSRKELHFFDNNFNRGTEWYRHHFREAGEARAVGEASPSYMFFPATLDRLASVLPEARLVAILRHPVDRAYSHYWMNRGQGREALSFSEALAAEYERTRGGGLATRRFAYLGGGRYLRQLQDVAERFGRHQLHVMLLDDLQDEAERTYAQLCRFLGVDDGFRPSALGQRLNTPTALRSPWLWRLSHRFPRWLQPLGRTVAGWNERPLSYPPLDLDLRRRLLEELDEEIVALGAWLGRDLSSWRS